MKISTAIGRLRMVGLIEGISLLLLLFIAMPLKYLAGMPDIVKVVGWAHGVLFVAFAIAVANAFFARKLSFLNVIIAFVASLIPFGTFWFDKRLKNAEVAAVEVRENKLAA